VIHDLREERREPDPFSLDEVTKLLTDGLHTEWERRYFEVAFFTGLRPSEQIGLQWDDIDGSRQLICVRRGVGRFGEGDTKTEARCARSTCCPQYDGHLRRSGRAPTGRASGSFQMTGAAR